MKRIVLFKKLSIMKFQINKTLPSLPLNYQSKVYNLTIVGLLFIAGPSIFYNLILAHSHSHVQFAFYQLSIFTVLLVLLVIFNKHPDQQQLIAKISLIPISVFFISGIFDYVSGNIGIYSILILPVVLTLASYSFFCYFVISINLLALVIITYLQSLGVIMTQASIETLIKLIFGFLLISFIDIWAMYLTSTLYGKVESEKKRLHVLIENIPATVFMVDLPTAKISIVNLKAKEMFGDSITPGKTIEGMASYLHLHKNNGEPLPEDLLPLNQALNQQQTAEIINIYTVRKDGAKTYLKYAAAPIINSDGETTSTVVVIEDMTKEHEIETTKSELLSLASHQMKTPLTGMNWSLELLRDMAVDRQTEEEKEIIDNMQSTVSRLVRLIGDLLSVSRIETGRKFDINKKLTNVVPVIRSILSDLTNQAKAKKVVIITDELPEQILLNIDADKLREALANLIDNAIKYSKDCGQVEVGCKQDKRYGELLFVRDNGVGIPQDEQDKLFNRFFRASNVTESIDGTGLGLYITKEIIERHGGELWYESKENKGTTFYLKLT